MNISPPISWTFFPSKASDASNTIWYFVGQSNTSTQANQLATAEITACVSVSVINKKNLQITEAMIAANLPVQGITITENYNSFQVFP